jgi:hypothetical protein
MTHGATSPSGDDHTTSTADTGDDAFEFLNGWELGALDTLLRVGRPANVRQPIHSTNRDRVPDIAERYGYTLRFIDGGLGSPRWAWIDLTRDEDHPQDNRRTGRPACCTDDGCSGYTTRGD